MRIWFEGAGLSRLRVMSLCGVLGAVLSIGLMVPAGSARAQDATAEPYRLPPAPIAQILDAEPLPASSLSPDRRVLALMGRSNLPPIAELAEPELRLAGSRINPRTNGPSSPAWMTSITLRDLGSGLERAVALPEGTRFAWTSWSPDGRHMAFLVPDETGMRLWTLDVARAEARPLSTRAISAVWGTGFSWLPDSSGLIVRLVPEGRGPEPAAPRAPSGPIVQENAGTAAPVRTYQDLLANAHDEALFEHYFTSQIATLALDGRISEIGAPALYSGVSLSPDGRFILTTAIQRPYSYIVPASLFPATVRVIDRQGRTVHEVARLPLRDTIPSRFDAVATGPRAVQWRSDADATLVWVEAQDGGDPRSSAEVRDRVLMLDAPFSGPARTLIDLAERYSDIDWGSESVAIVTSRWWLTRNETRHLVDPSRPGTGRVLLSRNYQDRYNNPGSPVYRTNARGRAVMHMTPDGGGIYMSGPGASREGEFPFLDRLDLASGESERLWQAQAPHFESVVALLDDEARRLITSRQSRTEVPNLFVIYRNSGDREPITRFEDPAPQFAGVTQQLITYTRADGVALSGTLYLPAGYDPARDGPLPLLMWAYPTEFTDASVAGQVVDRDNRFIRPGGSSHLFLLTQGYAILDNPSMPIIGEGGAEPNDTYVEQLVASAAAAIDAVVEMGVAERDRIAIGGHSYGAFMTANLLAHSDLFRTGIARSGAYNRTLTPFGFQAEQRTYWEATDTYTRMSPFTYANRINEPILLIHGEVDNNSGTFPIQSERFYAALKGHGATVRYVVLPHESHGYRARESVMHTLWEMVDWLDRHLKNAP